jgi:hypothetical protein
MREWNYLPEAAKGMVSISPLSRPGQNVKQKALSYHFVACNHDAWGSRVGAKAIRFMRL